ncbi:hypothetical protein ES705_29422 [subsurface metagenome]
MVACKKIVEIKGLPLSIYMDKDSKFITTRHKGIQVNLKGDDGETQLKRVWEELGIKVI